VLDFRDNAAVLEMLQLFKASRFGKVKDKNVGAELILMDMELEDIKCKIVPILKRYDVKRAALFGSFVRGEQREDSDIDILVEFKDGKSLLDLAGLKIELEEALGRKVDVLTYNSLHPLLRDKILQEQKVIL